MARGNQFGTFGGVFTPSILTILGVIMYMRLPRLVGQAGLVDVLGIIAVAHVISIATGLSVSSIATNKTVRGGGPYYIISRSLGLPLGGTLGLALFAGLAFSISLYVIGFSESFLSFFDFETNHDTIRICGSITLLVLTVITFVSTSLAIKTQYLILGAIVLSLIAIFFGPGVTGADGVPPAGPNLDPWPDAPDVGVLFGIFFPAVTGFTAGVNLSGDLKDPKRSLPRGTLLAIGAGLATYAGLAVFLAYTVPTRLLVENPDVLLDMAIHPNFVVAGVWGATLSSALGSILGAPRILQALSLDRVTPKVFGVGFGRGNEPRNALVLAFAIAEAGILIGELDVIARIVSMFFLMTYGFLNLSCVLEKWGSPDFRPDFRIPGIVSVVGALTCVVIMAQLDKVAMVAAAALLAGIFAYLKRRELTLEAGDTWEGVWASVIRSGLHRLTQGVPHPRNWSPNILLFSHPDEAVREPLRDLAGSLIARRGVLTEFELVEARSSGTLLRGTLAPTSEPLAMGVFRRQVPYTDLYDTMAAVCRFHGFSGVEPNTVLMEWHEHREDPDRFASLVDDIWLSDHNLVLLAYAAERGFGARLRVDVWWDAGAASSHFALAILRFVTSSDAWRRARVRFVVVDDGSYKSEAVVGILERLLAEARVDADVKVLPNARTARPREELIRQESSDADLVILGLADTPLAGQPGRVHALDALIEALGTVILLRGSSAFRPSGPLTDERAAQELAAAEAADAELELPALTLSEQGDVAAETTRFAEAHEEVISGFVERSVTLPSRHQVALLDDIAVLVDKALQQIARSLDAAGPRRRKAVGRAQSAFLFQSSRRVSDFIDSEVGAQADALRHGVEWLERHIERARASSPQALLIQRPPETWQPSAEDAPHLRRFKRGRRFWAWIERRPLPYRVPLHRIVDHALSYETRTLAYNAIAEFALDSHRGTVALAELLAFVRQRLARLGHLALVEAEGSAEERAEIEAEVRERVEAFGTRTRDEELRRRQRVLGAARQVVQRYGDQLDQLDVHHTIARERRIPRSARRLADKLRDAPDAWEITHRLVLGRAELALQVGSFHQRLARIVERARSSISLRVQTDIVRPYAALVAALETFREGLAAGPRPRLDVPIATGGGFDDRHVVEDILAEVHAATSELPVEVETLGDDSIQRLSSDALDEPDPLTVPLRRVVERELGEALIAQLRVELVKLPLAEQRALGVSQDVLRLISFDLTDLGGDDEGEGDALARHLGPALDSGIERVRGELASLEALAEQLPRAIDRQLEVVFDRTNPWRLAATGEGRAGGSGLSLAALLPTFARSWRGVRIASGRGLMRLVYRRSSGVLFARGLAQRRARPGAVIDNVLALIERSRPQREMLESLPFYYRQLFLGKSRVNEAFWVGRERELTEAGRAVERYRRGHHGALVVVGERGSGKSSLCQLVATQQFDPAHVHDVHPAPGGTTEVAQLDDALREALGGLSSVEEALQTTPEGTVLILHDIELWWGRERGGAASLERLMSLIDRYSDRCFFVLNLRTRPFRFLDRLTRLSDRALAVIECGPLDAEALKDIVMLRHRSTGLAFTLDGRPEATLRDWRLARLFSAHFDSSRGMVGVALASWIAGIDRVEGNTVTIRSPSHWPLEAFEGLRVSWLAIVLQLILHRQLTRDRLSRISQLPEAEIMEDLAALVRMGLITEDRRGVLELDPLAEHLLVAHLDRRGQLP